MSFLAWLEQTSLAIWVGESLYGYPFLLGMHVVGLALIVGLTTVVNLRLLSILKEPPIDSLQVLLRIAWGGFAINAISGVALFTSQATYFITNTPFLTKITLIAFGVASVVLVQRRLAAGEISLVILPTASLLCWLGAIIAGRLIAYL